MRTDHLAGNDPTNAVINFDRAAKFAKDARQRALALSHLARCKYVLGEFGDAAEFSARAASADPKQPRLWYEASGYAARAGRLKEVIPALRSAIEGDWTYFGLSLSNPLFREMQGSVQRLLSEIRAEQRNKAEQALARQERAGEIASRLGIRVDLERVALDEQMSQGNVYDYLAVQSRACRAVRHFLEAAQASVNLRKETIECQRESLRSNMKRERAEMEAQVGRININVDREAVGAGCMLLAIVLVIAGVVAAFTWKALAPLGFQKPWSPFEVVGGIVGGVIVLFLVAISTFGIGVYFCAPILEASRRRRQAGEYAQVERESVRMKDTLSAAPNVGARELNELWVLAKEMGDVTGASRVYGK